MTTTQDRRDHDVIEGPVGAEETSARLAPAATFDAPADVPEARLRDNRDFLVVLFGQGISSFGDAITVTALPLLVLALTGSGLAMGVVGVLTTLPDLILGLPAGAYADRWSRRTMMFVADLGRCVLTAMIPVSVALGGPTLVVILAVTFPLNSLRVLWLAAYTAAVPGLVGRAEVPRANAIFEAVFNVGWIVGPALAGLLAATIGPGRRSPSTPSRSCSRPARCCSSGGRCGPRRGPSRRTSWPTSARASPTWSGSRRFGRASRCGRRRR